MNIDIFIPVRLDSNRLPKKHLMEINGKTVLKILVERLRNSKRVRKIIVCTTNRDVDNEIVKFCEGEKVEYFRGENKDILVRFLLAAKKFDTDLIVDVEGDKIYMDPEYVDLAIDEAMISGADYVDGHAYNNNVNFFIHGIIPAVIRATALEKICNMKTTTNTETGYKEFFTNNNIIKSRSVNLEPMLDIPHNIRLTLDYMEDFELAKEIFPALDSNFKTRDILNLFRKKPELLEITKPVIDTWWKHYSQNVTNIKLKE